MENKELKVSRLTPKDIEDIKKSDRMFSRLIEDNKNFIYSIIAKFEDYDTQILTQEGRISLWKAIYKYDASKSKNTDASGRGSFSTFAHKCITNDILQFVRKVNKCRNVEIPMEKYRRLQFNGDLGDNSRQEYNEKHWKNRKVDLTNFEEVQLDKLQRESMIKDFSEIEKQMYVMKVIENRKVSYILNTLSKQKNISSYTVKNIYYKSFRPKIKEKLGEKA